MTKIEELEQKLDNAVEKFRLEMNECQKALAELKESKKEGKWKPKYDDIYFYIGDSGIITKRCCSDNQFDEWRYKNTAIFKTEKECERYKYFMDTVKEKSYEFSKEEWEDVNIRKYYIFYSYNNTYFKVHSDLHCKELGKIYFRDEESAQYIIDNFKDELMEYFVKGEIKNV